MKLFLGWSGETSHKVALALHGWIPKVIQAVKPYVSSEDIAKGARWSSDIAKELQASSFGIICVTRENANSAWINFEAGALSREIEKTHVTPFLFDLRPAEIQGPLAQFQSTIYTKDDVGKLVATINSQQQPEVQLAKDVLAASFEIWWPHLQIELDGIQREAASTRPAPAKPDPTTLLAELLETTRAMQRELSLIQKRSERERDRIVSELTKEFDQLYAAVDRRLATVEPINKEDIEVVWKRVQAALRKQTEQSRNAAAERLKAAMATAAQAESTERDSTAT